MTGSHQSTWEGPFYQLIEKHAINSPEAIALSFQGETLTYRALNEQANQLAHLLQAEGVMADAYVGIMLERSLALVVTLLAITKAGGTYIPIDPTYPLERIRYLISNAGIQMMITQSSLSDQLADLVLKKIYVDEEQEQLGFFSKANVELTVTPEQLAYVIYTSGSTGKPKGVMITHANVMHAYHGWQHSYALNPTDYHLQMANAAFDVFTGDVIRALCFGGKLVLCPKETLLVPQALYQLLRHETITCAEFVPAILRRLITYVEKSKLKLDFMRLIICGSDNWSLSEYRQVQRLAGPITRVINSYGITEATIDSAYFEEPIMATEFFALDHSIPIGKPFLNTDILLVDQELNPVALGDTGEICISGGGVAKGYLNNPSLSNQKFIQHTFSQSSEQYIYKTGDLGRQLADGNIEFLGRLDNQIKLLGMRVELNDIENALNTHSLVRESVVVLSKHAQLIAYLEVDPTTGIDSNAMRQYLSHKLPAYMIPTFFVSLAALPLTPNGKLDRNTLENTVFSPHNGNEIPRSTTEQQVLTLWQDVLHLENIGILDDFCALGGNSLLLANVCIKVETLFSIHIEVSKLPLMLNIATLSQYIDDQLQMRQTSA